MNQMNVSPAPKDPGHNSRDEPSFAQSLVIVGLLGTPFLGWKLANSLPPTLVFASLGLPIIALALLIVVRWLVQLRWTVTHKSASRFRLNLYHIAYIQGGYTRVADATVATLIHKGVVSVDETGNLFLNESLEFQASDPIEQACHDALEHETRVALHQVRRQLSRATQAAVVRALRESGVLLPDWRQKAFDAAHLTMGFVVYLVSSTYVSALICDKATEPTVGGLLGSLMHWFATGFLSSMLVIFAPMMAAELVHSERTDAGAHRLVSYAKRQGIHDWNSPKLGADSIIEKIALEGIEAVPEGASLELKTLSRIAREEQAAAMENNA